MYNIAENNKMLVPDDSDTYPNKIANPGEENPDEENLSNKLKEDEKMRQLGISENTELLTNEKSNIVPFDNTEHGIHYSFIDYKVEIPQSMNNTKLNTDQIIYQVSDLNDAIVRKMISFRKNSLNFVDICKKPSVNSVFIREFLDKIDFAELTKNDVITNDNFKIIDEFDEYFNWDDLCKNVKISISFIEKYFDKIKWDSIIFNITFNECLIRKYSDKINFARLLDYENRVLSNYFVREHIEELNIDTEDKMLRLFNNLPFNGNFFQTIRLNEKMTDDMRDDVYIDKISQSNTHMKTFETSWKNDKKKYEEIREDLSKKVPSSIVSPWYNTEEILE